MITGDKKVIRDLDRFERGFGEHSDDFGRELKDRIKFAIHFVGAIDTGAMVDAIDYTKSFVVDGGHTMFVGALKNPDVFYDGFVEFDTANRDGTIRPGQKFYERGIQKADFERIFNDIAREAFVV